MQQAEQAAKAGEGDSAKTDQAKTLKSQLESLNAELAELQNQKLQAQQ